MKRLTPNLLIPEHLDIYADTNMLKTIFQNLMSNAIKYSYPGEIITINAELKNNQIEISVSDKGKGMSEETINKLFKIDKHVSEPGTSNEKGSGLGLILCKDFIDRHNGLIWVESNPGEGSKFIFRIPQEEG
ncbi:MAG TPA: ATP-binding protein [Prolixibacteraceae bacterium]|nr:ATP-binding protein [Prolixibacteraceae bacterium]